MTHSTPETATEHAFGDQSTQVAILPVAAALVCIGVLIGRAPDIFEPQFWAEDSIFWREAYLDGPRALFRPYAGYLLTAPRLTAALSTLWHPMWAPAIFVTVTLCATAWCAATAATSQLPPWLGFVLGASLTIAPQQTGDIFGYAVNLQWVAAPVLAVIAGTDPPTNRFARANQTAFVAIAAFTGPFSAFLAPLFATRIIRCRDLASAIALSAACVQFATLVTSAAPFPPSGPPERLHLISAFAQQLAPGPAAALAATLLIVLAVMIPKGRRLRVALLFLSAAVCAGALLRYGQQPHAFDNPGQAGRYIFVQHTALIWCAASLAFTGRTVRWIVGAAIVVFMSAFPLDVFRRLAPPDKNWKAYAVEIGIRPVEIPTLPDWHLSLP